MHFKLLRVKRCVQENVEHSVHRGEQFKETFPYLTFDDSVNQLALQQNKKEIGTKILKI